MKITATKLARHKASGGGFLSGRNIRGGNVMLRITKYMAVILALIVVLASITNRTNFVVISTLPHKKAMAYDGLNVTTGPPEDDEVQWLLAVHYPQTYDYNEQRHNNNNDTKASFLARQPSYLQIVRIRIETKVVITTTTNKPYYFWNPFGNKATEPPSSRHDTEVKQEVIVGEPFRVHAFGSEKPPKLLVAHDKGNIAVVKPCNLLSCVTYMGVNDDQQQETSRQGRRRRPKLVELPSQAYSVFVNGTSVYLGFPTSVGWVDFSKDKPKYEELFRRQLDYEYGGYDIFPKKYDMFASKDDLLIAIDDVASPYYADTFRIDAGGNPTHEESLDLPSVVYGHYFLVEIMAEGENDDQLLLANTWSGMSGSGQSLMRRPLEDFCRPADEARTFREDRCKSGSEEGGGHWWAERFSFGYAQEGYRDNWKGWKPKPEDVTMWKGIAVRKNHASTTPDSNKSSDILLAAGGRGLITLPGNFIGTTMPSFTTFDDGSVDAVRTFGNEAWVLVNSIEASKVVNVATRKEIILPAYTNKWLSSTKIVEKGYYNDLL